MKPSEDGKDWDSLRDRIIGLGERSVHKNYYPALRRNLADLNKLMRAVEQTTVGLIICNRDCVIEFVNPAMCALTGYAAEEIVGHTPGLYRSATTPKAVYADMWAKLNAGQPWRGEVQNCRKNGETYWIRLSITPIKDEIGAVTHFVGINEDITERIRAQERQKLLLDELNHRVKNTLAEVQAVAAQTLRSAASPDEFCRNFQGRLMALSRAHNLLNRTAWAGASLGDLLGEGLAPYAGQFGLEGGEVKLAPDPAVVLSMAFHELATNAAKYGAFSRPAGRVMVQWTREAGRILHMQWQETGGPSAARPERRGFGLSLLERGLAHQLGGRVHLDFTPQGLHCDMVLELDRMEARGA